MHTTHPPPLAENLTSTPQSPSSGPAPSLTPQPMRSTTRTALPSWQPHHDAAPPPQQQQQRGHARVRVRYTRGAGLAASAATKLGHVEKPIRGPHGSVTAAHMCPQSLCWK
ncbi:hypothetical protein HRG_005777 [Hirsutella rhossiliensis]|uniref:Uncharacterized protein n=1 Tax=Hirsutella rhossiliensis TaxID=111463 RepID=A0A9P8N210_9HYPO|nr:uncharacterized protein HRG_05777 [Hirsutella rhossiliensis]KAH0963267.1 hypothetical protein HRG_05777 [Hirsutella rhossiliensis]